MAAKTQTTKAGRIQRGKYGLGVYSIYLVVYTEIKDGLTEIYLQKESSLWPSDGITFYVLSRFTVLFLTWRLKGLLDKEDQESEVIKDSPDSPEPLNKKPRLSTEEVQPPERAKGTNPHPTSLLSSGPTVFCQTGQGNHFWLFSHSLLNHSRLKQTAQICFQLMTSVRP